MSKMKELYKKVAADEGLQQRINQIFEAAGADADAAAQKLVGFAKEQGYDVTDAEIGEFFKSMAETSGGPLSDQDLDSVAGGKRPGDGGMLTTSDPRKCEQLVSTIQHCYFKF